jgi:2-methylcitrate dehydratase PrpD
VTATDDLLDFAAARHVLPDGVRADAVRLLGDTLVVGAAGAGAPGADGVLAAARGWGAGTEARLLGTDGRLPATGAAFVNAFRIHCLEWDAVHEPAVVHALSVVTAALLAAIDRRGGCDPDEALVALAVGVDVAAGLGLAATSPLNFFRPAVCGTIGAALAVARIEGVTRDRLPDVLGLAHTSCAGTMQAHVEGSIALPLQVANAARAAVAAVDLVRARLTGPHDALEGPFGHFALFDRGDLRTYTAHLGTVWRIAEVSTKPYPSGRASHGVLGALADQHDVATVEAFVPPLIHRLVGRAPFAGMSPAHARLCLPFLAALMIRDGRIDPRRFTPATFSDPHIAALAARVTVTVDGNPDPNALFPQRLVVTRADGSRAEIAVPNTLGSPAAPLSPTQSAAKLGLARELAPDADARIFDNPLAYFTGGA